MQIHKIINEKGDRKREMEEIQKIVRFYCKSLYATKLEDIDEMGSYLERHQISKLIQE